jgi:hypothetical protein
MKLVYLWPYRNSEELSYSMGLVQKPKNTEYDDFEPDKNRTHCKRQSLGRLRISGSKMLILPLSNNRLLDFG